MNDEYTSLDTDEAVDKNYNSAIKFNRSLDNILDYTLSFQTLLIGIDTINLTDQNYFKITF